MVLQTPMGRSALRSTFNSAVPFAAPETVFASHTVAAAITFTIAAGAKMPGATTIYRLVANGVNVPNLAAFKALNTDAGYDNRLNVINVIKFTFDGADHWVEVWQEKGVLPTLQAIALTFPTRAGNTITNVGQVYTPAASATTFDSFMCSAQAIPANKAGRIVVKTADVNIVALCDTAVAESWTSNNLDYFMWSSPAFTGYRGTAVVNSNVAVSNPGWFRLTRNSAGTVTAESSNDGTSWTLIRTYAVTTLVPLWVTCNLSGSGQKTLEIISFEVEP
jgi:hypothetical protein